MIDGKLEEFVSNGMARGRISFGDVRRLQRGCLPTGIRTREEAEALIALNAKLVRADRTWAQWLVGAVADFVAKHDECEQSEGATAEWMAPLLAASAPATNLGRRIARQIRRELVRLRADRSTSADQPGPVCVRSGDVQEPSATAAPEMISAIVRSEIVVRGPPADIPGGLECAARVGKHASTRASSRSRPRPTASRRRGRRATTARMHGTEAQADRQAEQGAG